MTKTMRADLESFICRLKAMRTDPTDFLYEEMGEKRYLETRAALAKFLHAEDSDEIWVKAINHVLEM